MPALVEKTGNGKTGGIWEVKWTWMPAFLAMDRELVAFVDKHLNDWFAGGDPPMPGILDKAVIKLVCQKYPMHGLLEALLAIQAVDPALSDKQIDNVTIQQAVVENGL